MGEAITIMIVIIKHVTVKIVRLCPHCSVRTATKPACSVTEVLAIFDHNSV